MAVETSTPAERLSRFDSSAETILAVALGFMASKHLFAASEIGLFEYLAQGPNPLDELVARTGVPRRTLRIVADAMVALGLLKCDGNRYENSEAAQTFLSGQTAHDLRPLLSGWDQVSYPMWQGLATSVRAGQSWMLHDQLSENEERLRWAAMDALAAGPARALARAFDFRGHQ